MKTICQQIFDGELKYSEAPQRTYKSFDYGSVTLDFTIFTDGSVHFEEFFVGNPEENVAIGFKDVEEAYNYFGNPKSNIKQWLGTQLPTTVAA